MKLFGHTQLGMTRCEHALLLEFHTRTFMPVEINHSSRHSWPGEKNPEIQGKSPLSRASSKCKAVNNMINRFISADTILGSRWEMTQNICNFKNNKSVRTAQMR